MSKKLTTGLSIILGLLMVMSSLVFVGPAEALADKRRPTVPAVSSITAAPTSLTVRWSASRDNVGVTGYQVLVNGAVRARPRGRVATIGGLRSSTSYRIQVRARDAAGNWSGLSAVKTGRTLAPPDRVPPSIPVVTSGTATASAVTIRWNASSDARGVAGYETRIGTGAIARHSAAVRTRSFTGLRNGTSYVAYVRAFDAAGNRSAWRSRTVRTVDTAGPAAPAISAATVSGSTVSLSWRAASDNVGVTGYRVQLDGKRVTSLAASARSYRLTALQPGRHTVAVRAVDAAGNLGVLSTRTVTIADTAKPSQPAITSLTSTASSVTVRWGAATDNVGVVAYEVLLGGSSVIRVSAASRARVFSGLRNGTNYAVYVRSVDAAGNRSAWRSKTIRTVDTAGPAAPGIRAATVSGSTATLSWNATTDNVGVTGYRVQLDGKRVANLAVSARSHRFTALTPGRHTVAVRAVDAAGNLGVLSTRTITIADTAKPSQPAITSLTSTASSVTVKWGASTDNVGVTAYEVKIGSAAVIRLAATLRSRAFSGLTNGTSYTVYVRSVDAAGNRSAWRSKTIRTVDSTPPVKPGITAATVAGSTATLSWNAATDNVGVTGYRVLVDGSRVANLDANARSHRVTGLQPGRYTLGVRGIDAAGNLGVLATRVVTVVDTSVPSKPAIASLTSTANSATVRWGASTDNVGVVAYEVKIGTAATIRVSAASRARVFSALSDGTDYTVYVRSVDAAGNRSVWSKKSVTTEDVTGPEKPTTEIPTVTGQSTTLTWTSVKDNVAVTGYQLLIKGSVVETVAATATSHRHTGLPFGEYYIGVRAVDAAGNVSATASRQITVTDTEAPSVPDVRATSEVRTLHVSWGESTDNVGVTGYRVLLDGELVEAVGPNVQTISVGRLDPSNDYRIAVRAVDAAGNISGPGAVQVTTKAIRPVEVDEPVVDGDSVVYRWTPDSDASVYRVLVDGEVVVTTEGHNAEILLSRLGPRAEVTLVGLDVDGLATTRMMVFPALAWPFSAATEPWEVSAEAFSKGIVVRWEGDETTTAEYVITLSKDGKVEATNTALGSSNLTTFSLSESGEYCPSIVAKPTSILSSPSAPVESVPKCVTYDVSWADPDPGHPPAGDAPCTPTCDFEAPVPEVDPGHPPAGDAPCTPTCDFEPSVPEVDPGHPPAGDAPCTPTCDFGPAPLSVWFEGNLLLTEWEEPGVFAVTVSGPDYEADWPALQTSHAVEATASGEWCVELKANITGEILRKGCAIRLATNGSGSSGACPAAMVFGQRKLDSIPMWFVQQQENQTFLLSSGGVEKLLIGGSDPSYVTEVFDLPLFEAQTIELYLLSNPDDTDTRILCASETIQGLGGRTSPPPEGETVCGYGDQGCVTFYGPDAAVAWAINEDPLAPPETGACTTLAAIGLAPLPLRWWADLLVGGGVDWVCISYGMLPKDAAAELLAQSGPPSLCLAVLGPFTHGFVVFDTSDDWPCYPSHGHVLPPGSSSNPSAGICADGTNTSGVSIADLNAQREAWEQLPPPRLSWYDSLTREQVHAIMFIPSADAAYDLRTELLKELRSGPDGSGGVHEFVPVSTAHFAKALGITAADIRNFTVPTADLVGYYDFAGAPGRGVPFRHRDQAYENFSSSYHDALIHQISISGSAQEALVLITAVNQSENNNIGVINDPDTAASVMNDDELRAARHDGRYTSLADMPKPVGWPTDWNSRSYVAPSPLACPS